MSDPATSNIKDVSISGIADRKPVVHLILELCEPQHFQNKGRAWLERFFIRIGVLPPFHEEEIGAVWIVPPGRSAERYDSEGLDITGPISCVTARKILENIQRAFESLGFTVIVETDYP